MKFLAVTLQVLLLVMLGSPLLAAMPCCPAAPCDPMFRPADTCCDVSALPEAPAQIRLAPAPDFAPGPQPAQRVVAEGDCLAANAGVPPVSFSPILDPPLRI